MTSLFPLLLTSVIPALLSLVLITAAVIAHRGKSFWGTWMMLLSSITALIGFVVTGIGYAMLFRNLSPSGGSASMGNTNLFAILSGVGGLLTAASILTFCISLLVLCARWGLVNHRAEELEGLASSLASG